MSGVSICLQSTVRKFYRVMRELKLFGYTKKRKVITTVSDHNGQSQLKTLGQTLLPAPGGASRIALVS